MGEEYICPNCKQPLEDGALFCGNCGQAVVETPEQQVPNKQVTEVYDNGPPDNQTTSYPNQLATAGSQVTPGSALPNYAIAYPHPKQHRAAMALAFGIVGIGAAIQVPILGVGLGLFGVILSTTSYRASSKGLKISSLIISIIAILVGLGIWVNVINHDTDAKRSATASQAANSNGVASLSVTTPCYTVGFSSALNVNNSQGSCAMNAYNGDSLVDSTNIYKVLTDSVSGLSTTNFANVTQKAISSDISKNLPSFTVTNESSTTFSGAPAYFIQANDTSQNVAVIEEGVFHQTTNDENDFFVLVHITSGKSTDLGGLAKAWQWNDK